MSTELFITSIIVHGLLCIFQLCLIAYLFLKLSGFGQQSDSSNNNHNNNTREKQETQLNFYTRFTGYGVLINGFILFLSMLFAYLIPLSMNNNNSNNNNYELYCNIEYRIRLLLLIFYELWLFYHWFGRIMYSFKGSMFELSPKQEKIGLLSIALIGVTFIVISIVFIQSDPISHSNNDNSFVCAAKGNTVALQIYVIALQATIIIVNIMFSFIFMNKLRAIYNYFQSGRLSSIGNDDSMDNIRKLVRKYVILSLTSLISTILTWILYIILPLLLINNKNNNNSNNNSKLSLYYSDLLILIMLDIFINSFCVVLMFAFAEKVYFQLLKCVPIGPLCNMLVTWIEKTQFPQKVRSKTKIISQKIKRIVNISSNNDKNDSDKPKIVPKTPPPKHNLPALPLPAGSSAMGSPGSGVGGSGSMGSANIMIELNPINFEKPQSGLIESDPDMPEELHIKPSRSSDGTNTSASGTHTHGHRNVKQVKLSQDY